MSDTISTLIEQIAPLNNRYRESIRKNLRGTEILKIMWDVGEILFEHNIKNIHPIAWKIYGREKGLRRSYITRDFLSYCFRIRNFFKSKSSIEKQFTSLQRYSLFREAFPLLENPKYELNEREIKELMALLNSNLPFSEIKGRVIKIKKAKIQIYNDRRQRLHEMAPMRDHFVKIYNILHSTIKDGNLEDAKVIRNDIGEEMLSQFSNLCLSFIQEGLTFPTIDRNKIKDIGTDWQQLLENCLKLSESNIETRNRFRRQVPISKIMEMAEMFNAIKTDDGFHLLKEKLEKFMI